MKNTFQSVNKLGATEKGINLCTSLKCLSKEEILIHDKERNNLNTWLRCKNKNTIIIKIISYISWGDSKNTKKIHLQYHVFFSAVFF